MSLVPGAVDVSRTADADLETLARMLVDIHALRPPMQPRTYQSWAIPAKRVVPEWAREPAAWERAFEICDEDAPAYEGTFLHRDFAPRNVLWTGTGHHRGRRLGGDVVGAALARRRPLPQQPGAHARDRGGRPVRRDVHAADRPRSRSRTST